MILYSLICSDGHRFDSWFRDGAAFDHQAGRHSLSCPFCGSTEVAKAIMAPALAGRGASTAVPVKDVALVDPKARELRGLLRHMRDKLLAEGHDVGREFAHEARRIHDGDAPARRIYGQATLGEARDLLEDGVVVLPMPIVPDELN